LEIRYSPFNRSNWMVIYLLGAGLYSALRG
jgi:hypothetical protein